MAVTRPFVFGTFNVFEGRSAYTLQSAQPVCYFDELSADMEGPVTELIFWKWPPYLAQGKHGRNRTFNTGLPDIKGPFKSVPSKPPGPADL